MEPDYVKLKEIKPALSGFIRASRALLKRSELPDEKAIHDVRVLMKKSRALVKLTISQQDNIYFDRNISSLKEVGTIMCSWRETSVQRKLLKSFQRKYPDIFFQLREKSRLTHLLEKNEPVTGSPEELKIALEKIDDLLSKTNYRVRFQSMKSADPQLLLKELDKSFTMIKDIYLLCRNNSKPALMHKFRKKAKDFLYQLVIFRPLNPPVVKALEKKLDEINDIKRFRISSIEPDLLTNDIIEFVSGSEKFVHHFHIPLQSGSDNILKLMRRSDLITTIRAFTNEKNATDYSMILLIPIW